MLLEEKVWARSVLVDLTDCGPTAEPSTRPFAATDPEADVRQRGALRMLLAEQLREAMGSVTKSMSNGAGRGGCIPCRRGQGDEDEDHGEGSADATIGGSSTYGLD